MFTVLAGCQTDSSESRSVDSDGAGKIYMACIYRQARALDDGQSDAGTVGVAAYSNCSQEFDAWTAILWRNLDLATQLSLKQKVKSKT